MFDRVRQRRPSVRVAVWLVVAIALTSIATGVVAIVTEPALRAAGVWGTVQSIVEFSGTVVGFALLVTAWGMRRGYRVAYVAAVVLVALEGVHGVAQSRLLSIPLVVLSVGGLVVLVLTSRRFTRSVSLESTQLGALLATVGVLCYGTAGSYALRGEFDGVESVVDAVYFTFVTASTVGYGDVHAAGDGARLFAISLAVLGPATVAIAAGSLAGPELEARLSRTGRRMAARERSRREERVVVLGYDGTTVPVLAELIDRAPVVVVTDDETQAPRLEDADVAVHRGDPTDEATLRDLDLADAAAVVAATGDEARTLYAVVAARDAEPEAYVVALAADGNVDALENVGADVAIDPWELLGTATVDAALGADDE